MEQMISKQHLVKLLFEEYKVDNQLDELENLGFDLSSLEVNNLPVILDIIGFPSDNSITEIERFDHESKSLILRQSPPDDEIFCREDLCNKFYEISSDLREQKKVMVTDKGLRIVPEIDTPEIEKALMEYIEWLYEELAKLGKKPE